MYISLVLFIIIIIFDLFFYINFKIHLYFDNKKLFIYFFSIPLLVIDNNKYYNFFYNKVSAEKINKKNKNGFKIIKSFKLEYIHLGISSNILSRYPILCSLFCLNNSKKTNIKITTKPKLYIVVDIKLSNFIKEIISIRKKERNNKLYKANERPSN